MSRLALIRQLPEFLGQEVRLLGWVANARSSGGIAFLILRDGTGLVQCVLERKVLGEETFQKVRKLSLETTVEVEGTPREDARSPGGVEIQVTAIRVLAESAEDYPIQKKEHSIGFLLDHRHLWIRTPRQQALLRVRHHLEQAICEYLDEAGYVRVDAPILTPTACEGTTTLFRVDYFDEEAYLSQSGQLYNEATAAALRKVYCFGPTFRAEKSKTRRHLTEFWMVEPEIAFIDFAGLLEAIEDFLVEIVRRTVERARGELEFLGRNLEALERVRKPLPRITYDEAIEILKKKGFSVEWGQDFGGDEETAISEAFDRPVMVTGYPTEVKAFYMKPDPQRPEVTQSVDVLAPEGYGEIIGGGQRNEDYESLRKRIQEEGLPEEAFTWYLDLRRYGSFPHGGWGLGVERTLAWITGIHHVREAIPFPRTIYRLRP